MASVLSNSSIFLIKNRFLSLHRFFLSRWNTAFEEIWISEVLIAQLLTVNMSYSCYRHPSYIILCFWKVEEQNLRPCDIIHCVKPLVKGFWELCGGSQLNLIQQLLLTVCKITCTCFFFYHPVHNIMWYFAVLWPVFNEQFPYLYHQWLEMTPTHISP